MRTIDTHSSALGSCALIHPAALSFPLFNAAIKQTSQKESGAGAAAAAGNVQCDVRYSPEPRPPGCRAAGVGWSGGEPNRRNKKKGEKKTYSDFRVSLRTLFFSKNFYFLRKNKQILEK